MIYWKRNQEYIAGTTLRDRNQAEYNNMALHCGGNLTEIIANRKRLVKEIGISLSQCTFANQTHSDHIVKVTQADAGKGAFQAADAIQDCDALYTRESNLLIGVFTADCVPILLFDPIEKIICAIHSGWMGTTKQITTKTMQVLITQEGCLAQNIYAYIGASIAFRSFEVGKEVVDQIKALPFDTTPFIAYQKNEKAFIDNKGLNQQMLINSGVQKDHIIIDKNDTFAENESFFSYRRNKQCGRHLSFIIRKEV